MITSMVHLKTASIDHVALGKDEYLRFLPDRWSRLVQGRLAPVTDISELEELEGYWQEVMAHNG